jgi:putative transcription antitermination factor YqgF
MKMQLSGDIIGLDVGSARTGVARMSTFAKIAEPLQPIVHAKTALHDGLAGLIADLSPCAVVVGLPRGLDGQETDQTRIVTDIYETLCSDFEKKGTLPFFLIDEAGTTKQAELRATKNQSVDSVAAAIILETFIVQLEKGNIENAFI